MSEYKGLPLETKLSLIRNMVPAVQKTKKGYGYTYVPLEEIQAKVTAAMNKYGVFLYPSIVPGTAHITPYSYTKQKFIKEGQNTRIVDETVNEFLYTAETIWHWVNLDNTDERMEIPWFATANMSDASQTMNSANTYQARGFLSAFLQIAMTDDPEAYRTKKLEAEEEERRLATKLIVDELHQYVVAYLGNNPDKKAEITETVKRYVKVDGKGSSDYYKLSDPNTATALFKDIRSKFPINESENEREVTRE